MLELFHWEPVGHSARVLICLHEAGVDYRSRYVDAINFEHFSPGFLKLNPLAQLPVLTDGDLVLSESGLINEFLAEAFPSSKLLPADPVGRYNVQVWSKFIDYNLSSSLATLGCKKYLVPFLKQYDQAGLGERISNIPVVERRAGWQRAAENDYDDDMVANAERKVGLVIARIEAALAEGDWLVGDNYGIADINAFAMIRGLQDSAPELVNEDRAERTVEWASRIAKRPAVIAALSSGEPTRYPQPLFIPGPEHSRWG